MAVILGVNCVSHNSSAALVIDGEPVAAVQQERFDRVKQSAAYPRDAIEFCLRRLGRRELEYVAVPLSPGTSAGRTITRLTADLPQSYEALRASLRYYEGLADHLTRLHELPVEPGRISYVGHHEAHLASAFHSSPFGESAVLSIDGSGDDSTAMYAHATNGGIRVIGATGMPDSLGYFYGAITQYLGFHPNVDEGKVMGLAPYGRRDLVGAFARILEPASGLSFRVDLRYFTYHCRAERMYSADLEAKFGEPRPPGAPVEARHEDLARAAQESLQVVVRHLAMGVLAETGSRRLCLGGGVALNSVANGMLAELPQVDAVHVAPDPGDGGTALGAALWLEHQLSPGRTSTSVATPYLGPEYDDSAIAEALARHGLRFTRLPSPARQAAKLVADGAILGWFQGRAEIGPRALGSRSILATPTDPTMKDKLNSRVKRRETFRPFAPAILEDRQAEYFSTTHPSYYMSHVHSVRPQMRDKIPAVVHVDGSGRLQTVSPALAPLFAAVITEFDKLTGIPVVLNTSFNVMGEPIVNTPDDAIRCYLGSGMDALVMGSHLLCKRDP
ncbi:MAG: carbamoyltransferase family protein [Micromonosporaceae bacterium]